MPWQVEPDKRVCGWPQDGRSTDVEVVAVGHPGLALCELAQPFLKSCRIARRPLWSPPQLIEFNVPNGKSCSESAGEIGLS
jgi:hypothetical protein